MPRALLLGCVIVGTLGVSIGAERLPFAERIRGYEAIERVVLSHRLECGTGRAIRLSSEHIESLVREDELLEQLLREKWATTIGQQDLNAEWQRIVRETWMPDRLEEIAAALDHDPLMVQECLVRPTLVRRLARNYYLSDRVEQASAWERAAQIAATTCSAGGDRVFGSPARVTVIVDPQSEKVADLRTQTLPHSSAPPDELAASECTCEFGHPTLEERGPWVFLGTTSVLPGDRSSRERLVVTPKVPWAVWRQGLSSPSLASLSSPPAEVVDSPIALEEGLRTLGTSARRASAAAANLRDLARESGVAVWTGSELVALGGSRAAAPAPPGVFDPMTASWMPLSTDGPGFLAIPLTGWWDGERVIVPDPDGVRGWAYSLERDAWSSLESVPERPRDAADSFLKNLPPELSALAALAKLGIPQDDAIRLVAPPAGQLVYADSQPVQFEWSGPSGAQYRIEWSSEMSFQKVIRSTPSWVASSTLTPASKLWSKVLALGKSTGSIYWRVQARSSGNTSSYSEASSLHLASAEAPAVLSPPFGRVYLTDEPPPELKWEASHNSLFQVVVSPTPDLAGAGRAILGKGYKLKGTSVRLSSKDWAKVLELAEKAGDGILYVGVQAKDMLGRIAPSAVVLVRVVKPEDGNWWLEAEADPPVLALEPGVAGDTTIYIYAGDAEGNPVSGLPVWITSSSGTLAGGAGPIITDDQGWAEETLTTATTALVDIRSGRAHAVTRVDVALPEWQVSVEAFPRAIFLPDSSRDGSARIVARVLDQFGAPVAGAAVRFTTTSGRMDSSGAERLTNRAGDVEDVVWTRNPATVSASTRWGSGSTEIGIDRTNFPPTAVITTTPAGGCHPRVQATFSGAGSRDSDGTIVEYRWLIESSNPDQGRPNPEIVSLTSPVISRVYENLQTLSVRLTTVDNQGSTGEASVTYSIDTNSSPTVDAGPPQIGIIGSSSPYTCSVTLCPAASDPDGQIVALKFKWGDSSAPVQGSGCQNHTYRGPSPTLGDYKVVVTAFDNGNRDGACNSPPPVGGSDPCTSRRSATDSTVITCPAAARLDSQLPPGAGGRQGVVVQHVQVNDGG